MLVVVNSLFRVIDAAIQGSVDCEDYISHFRLCAPHTNYRKADLKVTELCTLHIYRDTIYIEKRRQEAVLQQARGNNVGNETGETD